MRARIGIIGCGFGGLGLAIALKNAGFNDFFILERAQDVGGVWRDNTYPGAACDIASRLYSYSFDWQRDWSTVYAPQAEILKYIKDSIDRHHIAAHIRLNAEVRVAQFEDAEAIWRITTTDDQTFQCNVLISAVGVFSQPRIPELLGRDKFRGTQFHSAQWNHTVQLEGKKVAVIGNGASAIQFVPRIAQQVEKLYLFQRTPQHVMSKSSFPGSSKWDVRLQRYRWLRKLARLALFIKYERNIFRRTWLAVSRRKSAAAFQILLEAKIADETLRHSLKPTIPLDCKRPLGSDEWFDALQQPNTEVVTAAIDQITSDGILTADNTVRELDVIIYGTGFTNTAYLAPMRIVGAQGYELGDAWKRGAEAYLGMSVPRFPNFFILYGPNTNAPNMIFMLECQARFIVSCLRSMDRKAACTMTVSEASHRRFVAEMGRRLARTNIASTNCRSNFKQEDGRITVPWPGLSIEYWLRTLRVKERDYIFTYQPN